MDTKKIIKIATRQSPLAIAQASMVRDQLIKTHNLAEGAVELLAMTTTGDEIKDKALRAFGGKGLFTKEIEQALIDGRADLAVHSMKDVQSILPEGLHIPCVLERAPVEDAFLSTKAESLMDLPKGARLGTSSLRRGAQVKKLRPDIEIVPFRGNVQTRLVKLADDVADATLLAMAGLTRLDLLEDVRSVIPADMMLPAPAQGAIGVECRIDDERANALIKPLNHEPTQICIRAERSFLKKLDGSCHTPLAALAEIKGQKLHLRGQILSVDGAEDFYGQVEGALGKAGEIGTELASSLMKEAGPEFLKAFHS